MSQNSEANGGLGCGRTHLQRRLSMDSRIRTSAHSGTLWCVTSKTALWRACNIVYNMNWIPFDMRRHVPLHRYCFDAGADLIQQLSHHHELLNTVGPRQMACNRAV